MEEKESVSKVTKTTGSYRFRVEGFSALSTKVGDSIESPEFRICDYDWQLRIFPGGSLEQHKGYISFYLASKSSKSARASYKLFVKSQVIGGADESFQSSGVRHFEAKGVQVDGWGRDKFMSSAILMDPNNGYYDRAGDSIVFRVEITVIGELEAQFSTSAYLADSEHKHTLQSSLISLMEDEELSDITLKVGKDSIFAHRSVLCARSSVMRAMLCQSNFSEASSGIISIEGIQPNIIRELIHFMYTDRLSPQNCLDEIAAELFEASSLYDVKGVLRLCENFFVTKLDHENVLQTLILADTFNSKYLKEHIFQYVALNSQQIAHHKDFVQLKGDLLAETNLVIEFSNRRKGCTLDYGDKRNSCILM